MTEQFINGFDGSPVYCYEWNDVTSPIGVVQIFHGLAEHAIRYDEFAKVLNKAGFIVFAIDERCHGKTVKGKLGTYDKKDAFADTVRDQIFFSRMLKEKYKLPLYIFAHSYGTFIGQSYITKCDIYDKVILSASACMKARADVKAGLVISWFGNTFKKDKPAKMIEKINYSTYFKKVKTGHWICSDESVIKRYYDDPNCGRPLSYRFYYSMFKNLGKMYKWDAINRINRDKPILLLCGDQDPVGNMSKSVKKLYDLYKQLGLTVDLKIYPNARHEILNEPAIKQQVQQDIIEFIKK